MQDLNEICKAVAEVLPWEIQSTLLTIRDEGLTAEKIPEEIYTCLNELQLVDTDGRDVWLSRLGRNLVDHCTC